MEPNFDGSRELWRGYYGFASLVGQEVQNAHIALRNPIILTINLPSLAQVSRIVVRISSN